MVATTTKMDNAMVKKGKADSDKSAEREGGSVADREDGSKSIRI